MNQILKHSSFVLLFLLSSILGVKGQNMTHVQDQKVIVWSKDENGYRIQKIKEGNHEYILRTPLHLVQEQKPIQPTVQPIVQNNVVFATNDNYINYTVAEVQTPELVKSRLAYTSSGMQLDYNPAVQVEIERLLDHRGFIEMALGRAQYFLPHTEAVIAREGAPNGLKYLPLVESSYKPHSYSRSGARGIWQFMKGTARLYKLKVNRSVDQRLDPEKSAEAAIHFLTDLHDKFGDWNLALAAYNCGPGRVQRAINMSGMANPTYWDIRHLLPRETRRYVPKFIAATYVMENADQIGLLPNIVGYEMAKAHVEEIQQTNFKTTQPRKAAANAFIPQNSTLLTYTVKPGDNLGFIAEWYDTKASKIRGWNNISGNMIKPGQELRVYVPKSKKHVYKDINKLSFSEKRDNGNSPQQAAKDDKEKVLAQNQRQKTFVKYKIKNGDTLWDISRKNGVSIEDIKQLNNISNTRNLKPGMVIKIREKS